MQLITDFADQAVILPIATLATLGFLLLGWRRAALAWATVVPLTLLLVLLSKMLTLACATSVLGRLDLRSPSGHTAAAALVYGGLMGLLLPAAGRRITSLFPASLFAVIIGASRISLGAHTLWDVLAGGTFGIIGAWAMVWLSGSRPAAPRYRWALLAVLAFSATLLHGAHLDAEARIQDYARSAWPLWLCESVCRNCSPHTKEAPAQDFFAPPR